VKRTGMIGLGAHGPADGLSQEEQGLRGDMTVAIKPIHLAMRWTIV
jgi:hypothetical protein